MDNDAYVKKYRKQKTPEFFNKRLDNYKEV